VTKEQKDRKRDVAEYLPPVEKIQRELGKAESIDDFFGKEGIFSRLFAEAMETMLEAELTEHLGYEPYEAKGRRSGNSRNGKRAKKVRTSGGDTDLQVPRDRNSEFQSTLLKKHKANSNEIENKVLALYARGNSTRDIRAMLEELYGIDVSAATISAITDKIWPLVEEWPVAS
jgi:putative transposase